MNLVIKSILPASLLLMVTILVSCNKNRLNSTFLGEEIARKRLASALSDTTDVRHYEKLLIDNKEMAIELAEVYLFKVYGKEHIREQLPYECYLIDKYWVINGTLPVFSDGGNFEIIISATDGQLVRLIHSR
jgi:hypothetical protein